MRALALLLPVIFTACDNEKVVDETKLPAAAQEFIESHFPAAKITQVVKDRDNLNIDYDVILDNGVSLVFDKDGNCEYIETKTKLTDTVIPLKLLEYVAVNYPCHHIIEWEKDKTDQEIKLSNKLELKFNLSGPFLRIDN